MKTLIHNQFCKKHISGRWTFILLNKSLLRKEYDEIHVSHKIYDAWFLEFNPITNRLSDLFINYFGLWNYYQIGRQLPLLNEYEYLQWKWTEIRERRTSDED